MEIEKDRARRWLPYQFYRNLIAVPRETVDR